MEREDWQAALHGINDALWHDPDSAEAHFMFGCAMLAADQPGIARLAFDHVIREQPDKWQAVANLARAWEDLERYDKAEMYFRQALNMKPDNIPATMGMSAVTVNTGRHAECVEWSEKALKMQELRQARINRAFSLLHLGRFAEGWKGYAEGVGYQRWRERKYHFLDGGEPEPVWNGEKDARILITGEQGIGDQIAFLSVVPDMMAQGYQIAAIECYPKLRHLLQRTFPQIPVFGTQFEDPPGWRVPFTHNAAMSELMHHFRKRREDFTGEPYLEVEADQVEQWRLFFEYKTPAPRIGICWRGGSRKSHNWRRKSTELATFQPVFDAFPGAHFVSLEYKDPGDLRGWPVHHYQWATQTDDYENTAALVKNLDALVTVPTSVNHLAGALGVPVFCLVNERPHFHYGMGMPYYSSVRLFERGDINGLIDALGGVLFDDA